MTKFLEYLKEELNLKKKKWEVISLSDLDKKTRHRLWDMYVDTYQGIGLHIENETKFGNKIALIGSDGKKENKKYLLKKYILLLKQKGWYSETSHKITDILLKNNVPVIKDMEKIKLLLGKKFIEELKDGEYKRNLGSMGIVKKRLFGKFK